MGENKMFIAGPKDDVRLDVFIFQKLPEKISRTRARGLIIEEEILVNKKPSKPSYRLREGDVVDVHIPPEPKVELVAQNIPLKIVYEDNELLVLNKERGMVVHPAAGHAENTLVNALLSHVPEIEGVGEEGRPGIVHRLDKDTTGLMVAAKKESAMAYLQKEIRGGRVKRHYIALLKGHLTSLEGTVDLPLGRNPNDRKKMAVVASGRPSVTDYKVLCDFGGEYTLILAKLRTGRTHQIRVHMAHIKHPVAGDALYSRSKGMLGLLGQALHSVRLGFTHPVSGEYMDFIEGPPEDFQGALEKLEKRYKKEVPQWTLLKEEP